MYIVFSYYTRILFLEFKKLVANSQNTSNINYKFSLTKAQQHTSHCSQFSNLFWQSFFFPRPHLFFLGMTWYRSGNSPSSASAARSCSSSIQIVSFLKPLGAIIIKQNNTRELVFFSSTFTKIFNEMYDVAVCNVKCM